MEVLPALSFVMFALISAGCSGSSSRTHSGRSTDVAAATDDELGCGNVCDDARTECRTTCDSAGSCSADCEETWEGCRAKCPGGIKAAAAAPIHPIGSTPPPSGSSNSNNNPGLGNTTAAPGGAGGSGSDVNGINLTGSAGLNGIYVNGSAGINGINLTSAGAGGG